MAKTAFLFPGQGAQHIGMGRDFFEQIRESKEIFKEADEALQMDLSGLIFEGSEEDLKKTENTQPAILTASIAMLKALERDGIYCDYTAGLSLGEYSSLVMSKAIRFADALKIVRERGRFMQEAVPQGIGGMAAILGLDRAHLPAILEMSKSYGVVEVANYNSPEQIVISGMKEGLKIACDKAVELGAKKAVELPVSAPFHTSLLSSAGVKLEGELRKVELGELKTKVVSNVDGRVVETSDELVSKLVNQVSNSVLWQQSIEFMINEGVDTFVEIGPGKSLSGFAKRISKAMGKEVRILNVSSVESYKETVEKLTKGA
ncbi:MAG: ACP S-malonyltransferase [Gudongella sp.]|jgi:[acyl-carrier-protein] S-malonyltransferase|nr:ACP S-malonyltransferase [Gudongella sp.]